MELPELILENIRLPSLPIKQKVSKGIAALAMLVASQVAGCAPQFEVVQLDLSAEHKGTDTWEGIQLPSHEVMVRTLREALQGDFHFQGYPQTHSLFDVMAHDHIQRRVEYLNLEEPQKPKFILVGSDNFKDILTPPEFEDTVHHFLTFLPKDWLGSTNVKKFEYSKVDHTMNVHPGYEYLSQPQYPVGSYDRDQKKVLLDKDAMTEDLHNFAGSFIVGLIHELLHSADARNLGKMNDEQFLELTYLIYQAVSDPDRPKFPETEEPQYNSSSRSHQSEVLQFKMNEYFAEMLTIAVTTWAESQDAWETNLMKTFKEKGASTEIAQRNIKIAKGYLKLVDSSYKPWESSQALWKIITDLTHKTGLPLYLKATRKIEDKDLRNFLQKTLEQKKEDLSDDDLLRKATDASFTFENNESEYAQGIMANELKDITDEKEKALYIAWLVEISRIARIQLEYWKFSFEKDRPILYRTREDFEKIEKLLREIPPQRRAEMKKKLIDVSHKIIFPHQEQN